MDGRQTWIQHSYYLILFTALFHSLQFAGGLVLGIRAGSPILSVFALDAIISALASLIFALRVRRYQAADVRGIADRWRCRLAGYGYLAVAAAAVFLSIPAFLQGPRPAGTILGIAIAAVSMLIIPVIGSTMKALAVELRSGAMKSAAVFTFGNSYLSMVLLVGLLLVSGRGLWWGDPLGALVMAPFIAQKGIQILLEEGNYESVED